MEMEIDRERAVVIKRADCQADRRRLGHEAAILRAAAHPGVVRVLGPEAARAATEDELAELTLELAPGGDLRGAADLPLGGAIGLGAAVATIVADLHHLGVVHGRIDEAHVLLDADGRPVLCGFGRASWLPSRGEGMELRRADVRAIVALLSGRVGHSAPRRLARCLRRAAATGCGGDARWLARSLIAAEPGSRRSGPASEGGHDDPRRLGARRSVVAAAAVVALAVAGLFVTGVLGWHPTSGPRPANARDVPCPVVDLGCGPLPAASGVLTVDGVRYAIGPAEIAVAGRWSCGRAALPAVLQVVSGDVWVFGDWPRPGQPATAHLVGRYPAANSLGVRPARSGCDELLVARSYRPTVVVHPNL